MYPKFHLQAQRQLVNPFWRLQANAWLRSRLNWAEKCTDRFPDVDIDYTTDGVMTAMRFSRQGQSCTAGSRLFIHESIKDKFLEVLTAKLKKMRVGDPLAEETDAGTVVNARQFERVSTYIQERSHANRRH